MIKTVNFDMDGVLVDLDQAIADAEGYTSPLAWWRSMKLTRSDDIRLMYHEVIKKHIGGGLFEFAPPMRDFPITFNLIQKLKHLGYKVNILSSKMNNEMSDDVESQKMKWLKRVGLYELCDSIYLVQSQEAKAAFMNDESVLIDDMDYTVNLMKSYGFPVIQYRNINQTINELIVLGVSV